MLSKLAIKKPVTFFMLFLAIAGLGGISFLRLHPELMPDITLPVCIVMAVYPNVGPEDIENLVTRPIEAQCATVTNVKEIHSIVSESSTLTMLRFNWGTNMDVAAMDVREKLDLIQGFFPSEVTRPIVMKMDPTMMPVSYIGLSGPLNLVELRKVAVKEVKPWLERIKGVALADVYGGKEREIQINVNRKRMEASGLTIQQIAGALGMQNLSYPGGNIKEGGKNYLIRTRGEFTSIDQIKNVVISSSGGSPIRVSDVADVKDSFKEKLSDTRVDGKPGLALMVMRASGAITTEVAKRVSKEIARINKKLPPGVKATVMFDQAEIINQAISIVFKVAIGGGILAVIILLLFLHNWRATFIVALAIPFSIIATFLAMDAGGLTLNMMSLGGLALAIGMLVDNAIVVLENTYRHREEGKGAEEAAVLGTQEVGTPIIASTLTTIAVFLPVMFIPGFIKIITQELALTVTFSLLVSLFMALTLIPLLCSRWLKVGGRTEPSAPTKPVGDDRRVVPWTDRVSTWLVDKFKQLDRSYTEALNWSLSHKKIVVFSVLGLLLISLGLIWPLRFVGTEFVPKVDTPIIGIQVKHPVGTPLEVTEKTVQRVEKIARARVPELRSIYASVGNPMAWMFGQAGGKTHIGTVDLQLVFPDERKRSIWEVAENIRPELARIPGIEWTLLPGQEAEMLEFSHLAGGLGMMMGGGGTPLVVEIYGKELETAKTLANQIRKRMEKIPGVKSAKISLEKVSPEYHIRIDRQKAASLGLSISAIANSIRANISGMLAGIFREGGNEYDIRVRLREEDRQSVKDLENLGLLISAISSGGVSPEVGMRAGITIPGGMMGGGDLSSQFGGLMASAGATMSMLAGGMSSLAGLPMPQMKTIPLSSVARIEPRLGPLTIEREAQKRILYITADYYGRDLGEITRDLEKSLSDLSVPPGFSLKLGGEIEEKEEAFHWLTLALIAAVCLVYAVMASLFESLRDPFVIMFTFPLAVIGAIWMFFLTGTTISIISFIGIIVLSGIAVNDGIVMLHCIRLLRQEGMELREAIVLGARRRLRPVLMTTFTTVFGVVPMVFYTGQGAEIRVPLALAFIGGLSAATLLTLFFVPIMYMIFEQRIPKRKKATTN